MSLWSIWCGVCVSVCVYGVSGGEFVRGCVAEYVMEYVCACVGYVVWVVGNVCVV